MIVQHIFILDPNLTGPGGHYLTFAKSISDAAVGLGITVTWITARAFNESLAPKAVNIIPIFPNNVFDEISSSGDNWAINNFNYLNDQFFKTLYALNLSSQTDSIFLFPNVLQNQLYAISSWSKFIDGSSHAVCILRWNNALMDYNLSRGAADIILQLYAYAMQHSDAASTKISVATDSKRLADFYQAVIRKPVTLLPNPQLSSQLLQTFHQKDSIKYISVGYFGGFSRLRGSHLLADIFDELLSRFDTISVRCHVGEIDSPDGESILRIQGQHKQRFSLLQGYLDEQLYNFALSTSSVLLMPYSPAFYGYGSSGIACEALSYGVPAVITKDTTMEDEFKDAGAGHIGVGQWDANSFADGAAAAIGSLAELSAQSVQAAEPFRAKVSPERFVRALLQIAMVKTIEN